MDYSDQYKKAWNQNQVPVVLRRTEKGEKLRLRLPVKDSDRKKYGNNDADSSWLRDSRPRIPRWSSKLECWEIPKKWFTDFVDRSLERYGSVYIIQPYVETEKCSPSCLNAKRHECQCSCMGANHGSGNDGSWFEISDAFAFRLGERSLACRLLTRKSRDQHI